MSTATAWFIEFSTDVRAAIGERELFHLLYRPAAHPLPCSPAHCFQVIQWEDRFLPLWDLERRLDRDASRSVASLVAIVGYQGQEGLTEFGALSVASPPQRISVDDADACSLPENRPAWRAIAKSCFSRAGSPVPVLDLASMFASRSC